MDFGTVKRVWLPLAMAACGMWILWRMPYVRHGPMRWVGMAIVLIGLAGVLVARYTLGKSFSVRAKATALVTRGIYSRIRNPIYVSGVVLLVGMAILLGQPIFLLFLAVIIPMQIWRAHNEARVLEEKFGDEYREYRKRTWF